MPVYAYTATSAAGGTVTPDRGTITADSPRQARDQLRDRGLSIRDLIEQKAGRGQNLFNRYLAGRQSAKVTGLLQEMATLLGAGIPLIETLDTITRQHEGRFQQSIMLLRDRVAAGGSLAEAMGEQAVLFDPLCVNIVEVGENAGTLDASLARLVEFRRQASSMKNRVASALMYPGIVLSVGVGISVFLMTFVMPQVLEVLEGTGQQLPFVTVVVKAISDFLLGWWWLLLMATAGLVSGATALLRTERGTLGLHRLLLRLPVLGDLLRKQAIARMATVMATLLKSDLPFVRAVRIAQRTVRNGVLQGALVVCEQAVVAGRDISDALEKTGAFPPMVIQVFAVGQASGRLEEMLENLAADYDTQVDIASSRLTVLLEPIMMIFLAIVVGFIAFAVILPILEAGNVL